MPTSRLPLDIKDFLTEVIDSVSHLEVLLMLCLKPDRSFSALEVSKELRSNVHSATSQLEILSQKGLLKYEDERFQYMPATAAMNESVLKLLDCYKEMPVAVVTCIYDKPTDKLRNFSDAFKFKKD